MRNDPMSDDADVVVVGGGPGGLALGAALDRHGVSSLILEAGAGIPVAARGEFLQPNGLRVLDWLHLLEFLLAQEVCRIDTVRMYRAGGQLLLVSSYRELDPPYNYVVVHKPHLLRQTLQARLGSARIWWNAPLERIERDGRHWRIVVRLPDGVRVVRAPMVVGADGVHSVVRRALGIRAAVRPYRDAYALTVVPRPQGFGESARQYYGGGALLGLLPVSSTELYVYWHVPAAQMERFRSLTVAQLKEEICAVAPDIGPSLELPPPGAWLCLRPARVNARPWVVDGGALLGDAAHALNPNAGQGTNQALEDAWVLAETIAGCLRTGRLRAQDLRRYEERRRPAAEFVQRLGEFYAFWWTSPSPLVNALHRRTARNATKCPELMRKMVAQSAGLTTTPLGLLEQLKLLL